MSRPRSHRRIAGQPAAAVFKPAGIPARLLDEVLMTLDEFEALRLADLEKLYHERAAEQMHVSRPTFSRIIDSAHAKIADALVHGKSLRFEGGPVQVQAGPLRCCRLHDRADGPRPDRDVPPPRPRERESTWISVYPSKQTTVSPARSVR